MSNNWINSPDLIEKYVKKSSNNFSFIDQIGSFVKNNRFKKGYIDLKQDNPTLESHVWKSLSAIGQDIGEVIYSNVINYIDNVSDVDVCKIKPLQSMMDLYGLDTQILKKYNTMPVEVQNLIDVFSINRSYLLKSGVLNSVIRGNLMTKVQTDLDNKEIKEIESSYLNVLHGLKIEIEDDRSIDNEIDGMFTSYKLLHNFDYSSNNGFDKTEYYEKMGYTSCDLSILNTNRIYIDETYESFSEQYFTIEKFNLISSIDPLCQKFYGVFLNRPYDELSSSKKIVSLISDFEQIVNFKKNTNVEYNDLFSNLELSNLFRIFNFGKYTDPEIIKSNIQNAQNIIDFDFENASNKKIQFLIDNEITNLNSEGKFDEFYDLKRRPKYEGQESITKWENKVNKLKSLAKEIKSSNEVILAKVESIQKITYDNIPKNNEYNPYIFRLSFISDNNVDFNYNYFDDNKYKLYLKDMFNDLLTGMCSLKYLPGIQSNLNRYETPIYLTLSSDLLQRKSINNEDYTTKFEKTLSGIDISFDEIAIADAIDQGLDSLDNYVGAWKTLIENEIEKRNLPLKFDENNYRSRTSYYREQKVKEYFKFIQNEYYSKRIYTKDQAYELDENYIEVDVLNSVYKYLLSGDVNHPESIGIDTSLIDQVSLDLANLTMDIQNIRSKLKVQAQKHYMKGTFNLLSYSINEYLIQFSKLNYELNNMSIGSEYRDENGVISVLTPIDTPINQYIDGFETLTSYTDLSTIYSETQLNDIYNIIDRSIQEIHSKLSSHILDDIEYIEYDDITEYYNINNKEFDASNKQTNLKFWENKTDNNGYKLAILQDEFEKFYLKTLKMNIASNPSNLSNSINNETDINRFLSALYTIGANNKNGIDNNGNFKIVVSDKDDTTLVENHKNLFLNFIGNKSGKLPHYNIKNSIHPSYQIHPYLKQFIEVSNINYTIENAFECGLVKELIYESSEAKAKKYIGNYGETINIWNGATDFTGYKDNYEVVNSNNQNDKNKKEEYPILGYSGPFFPLAIDDFRKNPESFIKEIEDVAKNRKSTSESEIYKKYYSHLNLSDADLEYEYNSLNEYKDKILDITELKKNKTDVYNIYKFGMDKYENQYILYKKYDSENPSYSDKENTLGELWIKLKDHPFAFPAFSGKYPVVLLSKNKTNRKLISLRDSSLLSSTYVNNLNTELSNRYDNYENKEMDHFIILDDLCYFFDIEFDLTRKTLFLVSYPINDSSLSGYYESLQNNFQKNKLQKNVQERQFAQILILNLEKTTNYLTNKTQFYMTNDEVVNYDTFPNSSFYTYNDNSFLSFLDFYKSSSRTGAVFVEKYIIENEEKQKIKEIKLIKNNENKLNVNISFYGYQDQSLTEQITQELQIEYPKYSNINNISSLYSICGDTIRFNYNNDDLVFVVLSELLSSSSINIKSYIGQVGSDGEYTYTLNNISSDNNEEDHDKSSFDQFDKFITIIDAKLSQNAVTIQDVSLHNLNNDPSYIPMYGGKRGKTNTWNSKKYKDVAYTSYELLGKSKNDGIKNSNYISSDFSLDINQLSSFQAGRVYEDYENNVQLFEFSNPNLFSNGLFDYGKYFKWEELLYFIEDDNTLSNFEILVFNTDNVNSPYYIGDLYSIYNATSGMKLSGYISSENTQEVSSIINGYDIKIAGTFENFDNSYSSINLNYIKNIEDIIISYDKESKKLLFKFNKKDRNQNYNILEDQVKIIIYDKIKLLSQYTLYHFLDTKGTVMYDISSSIDDYTEQQLLDSRYIISKNGDIYPLSTFTNISSYNDLTSNPILSGYNGLAFKYSEEDVYSITDGRFYYPGRNCVFPTIWSSIFDISSNTINTNEAYNQDNMFILQLEDSKKFADKIGKVSIQFQDNDINYLRVYEDYDKSVKVQNSNVLSSLHFCVEDEKILKDLSVITIPGKNEENEILSCYKIERDNYNLYSTFKNLEYLNNFDFYTLSAEELSSDNETNKIDLDLNSSNIDLQELLNIYIYYTIENDKSITLYFNYLNCLNTPYILYNPQTGENKPDVIEGSYLKLKSGEEGILDINVQIKAFYGNNIYGYRSAKLLSYKIYNVSDDKPKFIINKINEIKKDSLSIKN